MKRTRILLAAMLVGCLCAANAMAFNKMRAEGVDLGRASALSENSQVTITVALNLSRSGSRQSSRGGSPQCLPRRASSSLLETF